MGKDKKKKTKLSKEDKKNLTRCSVLLMASLVNLTVASLAWFTSNRENDIKPNRFDSKGVPFELAAVGGAGLYDDVLGQVPDGKKFTDEDVYRSNGGLKLSDGTIVSEGTITSGNGKIRWAMNSENNLKNYSDGQNDYDENEYLICPGSNGSLKFYIIPLENGSFDYDLSLKIDLYSNYYNNAAVSPETIEHMPAFSSDSRVKQIASGHIMFFRNRVQLEDGSYRYSGRIECDESMNMSFEKHIENAVKDTGYPETIYWVWPSLMGQMLLPDDNNILPGKYPPVFSIQDEKEKYIQELTENYSDYFYGYMSSDPEIEITNSSINETEAENMCPQIFDSTKISEIIEKICECRFLISDPNNDYSKLSYYWNKGDQLVGVSAAYITAEISASVKNS